MKKKLHTLFIRVQLLNYNSMRRGKIENNLIYLNENMSISLKKL